MLQFNEYWADLLVNADSYESTIFSSIPDFTHRVKTLERLYNTSYQISQFFNPEQTIVGYRDALKPGRLLLFLDEK